MTIAQQLKEMNVISDNDIVTLDIQLQYGNNPVDKRLKWGVERIKITKIIVRSFFDILANPYDHSKDLIYYEENKEVVC